MPGAEGQHKSATSATTPESSPSSKRLPSDRVGKDRSSEKRATGTGRGGKGSEIDQAMSNGRRLNGARMVKARGG
jgi:hypothetical protein